MPRPMKPPPLELHASAAAVRRFYAGLFTMAALLILATALSDVRSPLAANPIARQLDLKLEANAAVWYSSVVLLMAAVGALAIAERVRADAGMPRWGRFVWLVIAGFFVGLSVDETAQLHERVGVHFTNRFGTVPFLTDGGWPAFAWLLALFPLIGLFLGFVLVAVRTWVSMSARSRALILGGLACWVGVLLAEFVQAQLVRWSWDRSLQGALEEGLELTGATLFLVGFVELLRVDARRRDSDASRDVPFVA